MLVNIAGILSPILQQLLSVLVKRRSSAHFPLKRLSPSNEVMSKLKDTRKDGPQVGSMARRLSSLIGSLTENQKDLFHTC